MTARRRPPAPTCPATIRIGPVQYAVVVTAAAYAARMVVANEPFWGLIDYGEALIVLQPTHPDHVRLALLHEVLHGCWHLHEPLSETITEEQAIRTLTGSLLDTLRRNPALVAFLLTESPPHAVKS